MSTASKKTKRGKSVAIRYLKIVFVDLIAGLCLLYAAQNVVNHDACYQAFAYVMGRVDNVIYPASIIPAITSPALIWLALIVVVGLEFLAGLFAAKGAWDLWNARNAPAAEFQAAKSNALIGCGIGLVVWLGLFTVLGGALFQMWQTEVGGGSLGDSFSFFVACGLVWIIVNSADD